MQQVPQTEKQNQVPTRREELRKLFLDFNIGQNAMARRLKMPQSTFKLRLDGFRKLTVENEEQILVELRKMILAAESCFRTSLERQELREEIESEKNLKEISEL